MRVFNDFNDLKGAVGTEVGVSDWMEITQDRIKPKRPATSNGSTSTRNALHAKRLAGSRSRMDCSRSR